ncbi:hypothetical protein [Mucilaginibacter pedocola]|uniref:Lipoprotein n=1 Tax=Mucilaginibacter pedocola TaxID=1792845 RepID=A0A1S9PJZ8_9SPHI|nr:hypothetical protein [Mucilaginibacter pedocola]OOQ60908.1 hypothetical protein BC343_23390 [Mucilaginibacter pedocola]
MNKNLNLIGLIALCLLFCTGCKKSKVDPTLATEFRVEVKGFTDATKFYIEVRNQKSEQLLKVDGQSGNTTYKASPVTHGDVIRVIYRTNISSSTNGDGVGTVTFYYNGESRGSMGGFISSEQKVTDIKLP